jgi:hypothetical protein
VFFFQLLFQNPLVYLIALATILFGLVLHNVVQSLVAASLGDPTPRSRGYAGTDPQIHVPPIYLLFLAFFGFAIPNQIPLQVRNIRGRGGPEAFIWLSGALGMIAWALVVLIMSSLLAPILTGDLETIRSGLLQGAISVVSLAVVFIFPVPPLPGALALGAVGGMGARQFLSTMESFMIRLYPFGFMIVFLILSVTGILRLVTNAILQLMLSFMGVFGLGL